MLGATLLLSACAATAPSTPASEQTDASDYGIIDSVKPTRAAKAGESERPDAYQIGVRLNSGAYRTVKQDNIYDLAVGNRVRVVDGRVYRY
ncbi:MAG TPA: hypothetical protein DCW29_23475 [Janthinobacterium sp.]|nr:hypothetical protein [Janthinobacterium sp.]